MGFTFHVQMLGLCHFVPNEKPDSEERTRLCMLLPDLRDDQVLGPKHEPRLLYSEAKLDATPRRTPSRLTIRALQSERVTFEYFYEADAQRSPFRGDFDATVRMTEIASDFADRQVGIVSADAAEIGPIVGAQILFDRGQLLEDAPVGSFEVPQFLGNPVTRGLPRFVSVVERGLTKVVVHIDAFDGSRSETLTFSAGDAEEVRITLTADCDLQVAEALLAPPLLKRMPDDDFVAHYRFLSANSLAGLTLLHPNGLPVPVLLPIGSAAPAPAAVFAAAVQNVAAATPVLGVPALGGRVAIDRDGNLILAGGGSDCQGILAASRPLGLDRFLRSAA